MKSDVANVQLSEKRKVSYKEGALLAVILVIATKFCTLPSVLAAAANAKAVWAAFLLTAIELTTLFFAVKTAKRGGIPALDLPRPAMIVLFFFYAAFFLLKLAALSREIATYYALSLFENVPVLPVMILLFIAAALLGRGGYMAIGRMAEIFLWLFVFVALFIVIFTRSEGDLFNALAIFNPDVTGLGTAILRGAAWFGDAAVMSFLDLRGEERFSPHAMGDPVPPERRKAKRRIVFAAALFSLLSVFLFYAVFLSGYGDAAKMTDYAFIKISAFKANTDELGSADWPVIILWSVVTTMYLTLLLLSGKECLLGLIQKEESEKNSALPYFLLAGAAIAFALCVLEEEGDYEDYMTTAGSVLSFLAMGVTTGIGVVSIVKTKQEKHEE